MGEGMSVQIAKDGRRIIWLAHESAPKNFTGVDVSDPRNPKVVVQTDLPQAHMRSNSLELAGDIMAVAYQTQKTGQQPAGIELFDVSVPEKPRSISFFDCSGPTFARRASVVVLRRRIRAHGLRRARLQAEPPARRPVLPLHRRARSVEAEGGRPLVDAGHRATDNVAPPPRHPLDKGYRAHNTNVYPQRPDRLYLCYIDGGMFVMDIKDKANPKVISHWTNSPPYTGFMHTAVPLFDRNLMLVTDESTENAGKDWPKLIWILDMRDETHPVSISTCPLPPVDAYKDRGGRFGAHNIHENVAAADRRGSRDQIVLGTFFNGGLRAYDISNPYQPKEVGDLRAAAAERHAGRRGPAQRRVRRRARDRLHASTATPAGCTCWRWISELPSSRVPAKQGRRTATYPRARSARAR